MTRMPPLLGLIAFEEQKMPKEKMMLCGTCGGTGPMSRHPVPGAPSHVGLCMQERPSERWSQTNTPHLEARPESQDTQRPGV